MIYYVNPNIVSTSGKCSPNIRVYELKDAFHCVEYVNIYKNGKYTRKPYNRRIRLHWRATTIHNSMPSVTWYSPQVFSSLELATAYAIQAYQHTYALAEKRAANMLANLQQSAKLSATAEAFIDEHPDLFI